ncbi:MAG: hypothetical protein IKC18_00870 [Bacteroidaceae bacterium]|nr:hypothetical protein [Bacteroidaceae bacterium]
MIRKFALLSSDSMSELKLFTNQPPSLSKGAGEFRAANMRNVHPNSFFLKFCARQSLPHTFWPQEMRGSLCRALFSLKNRSGRPCRALFGHRKRAAASAEHFFGTK